MHGYRGRGTDTPQGKKLDYLINYDRGMYFTQMIRLVPVIPQLETCSDHLLRVLAGNRGEYWPLPIDRQTIGTHRPAVKSKVSLLAKTMFCIKALRPCILGIDGDIEGVEIARRTCVD